LWVDGVGVHRRRLYAAAGLLEGKKIEYDPQPPFQSRSATKADASTLRLALRALLGDRSVQMAHA
jgi:hypothetical protein